VWCVQAAPARGPGFNWFEDFHGEQGDERILSLATLVLTIMCTCLSLLNREHIKSDTGAALSILYVTALFFVVNQPFIAGILKAPDEHRIFIKWLFLGVLGMMGFTQVHCLLACITITTCNLRQTDKC